MKKEILILIFLLFSFTLFGTKLVAPKCGDQLAENNKKCVIEFDKCYSLCYNKFDKGEKRYYCKERCRKHKRFCADSAVNEFLDCIGD